MWDAIIALINKLPKEYLMIIIPALIGFFSFMLFRIFEEINKANFTGIQIDMNK